MIKAALLLLTTHRKLDKLALTKKALGQVNTINRRLQEGAGSGKKSSRKNNAVAISPILLYGTQSTAQINTAAIIGEVINKPVYKVDLLMLASKYIGETEKPLKSLFDTAAKKDWVLFFDEADALFGKRTNVKDAHDKYANLDTNYLLQRIEGHTGLVVLATNKKNNIDPAFTRRIKSIIYFPKAKKKNT